jgi:hypothetical protein
VAIASVSSLLFLSIFVQLGCSGRMSEPLNYGDVELVQMA